MLNSIFQSKSLGFAVQQRLSKSAGVENGKNVLLTMVCVCIILKAKSGYLKFTCAHSWPCIAYFYMDLY